jgi:hypothetical protein
VRENERGGGCGRWCWRPGDGVVGRVVAARQPGSGALVPLQCQCPLKSVPLFLSFAFSPRLTHIPGHPHREYQKFLFIIPNNSDLNAFKIQTWMHSATVKERTHAAPAALCCTMSIYHPLRNDSDMVITNFRYLQQFLCSTKQGSTRAHYWVASSWGSFGDLRALEQPSKL